MREGAAQSCDRGSTGGPSVGSTCPGTMPRSRLGQLQGSPERAGKDGQIATGVTQTLWDCGPTASAGSAISARCGGDQLRQPRPVAAQIAVASAARSRSVAQDTRG